MTLVLGAYILLIPAWGQVLHRPSAWWMRSWYMYHALGAEVCDVRFYRRENGVDTEIDRLAALGADAWGDLDDFKRRIRAPQAIGQAGAVLCRNVGAKDVRAEGRCGSPDGWVPAAKREQNLCGGRVLPPRAK